MPAELEALSLHDLRGRRDAVRAEEESLSYRRRLLHAQLDLVRAAEAARDRDEFESMLAEALGDEPRGGSTDVRAVAVEPRPEDDELDPLPEGLVEMSDAERGELLERLTALEQSISTRRRELLDELDALQDELVRRYRRDGVDARALLGEG